MANETIYPYGQGGQTPNGIGLNAGTFAEAYNLAKENNYIFSWMLIDEDENGNAIKKMMWHTSNGEFIDAIGASMSGQKDGLTVTVTKDCDMMVNGTRYSLLEGENNFSREDLSLGQNDVISNEILFYNTGTSTATNSSVTALDFGGITLRIDQIGSTKMAGFTNLTSIKRLNLANTSWFYHVFDECKIKKLTVTGSLSGTILGAFNGCSLLEQVDASKLYIYSMDNASTESQIFTNCPKLTELNIKGMSTGSMVLFKGIANSSPLQKLTIGNFSNAAMTSKGDCFGATTNAVLFVERNTPPVLKNCSFTNGVANDEHSTIYDWLSYTSGGQVVCRFSAIYVPDEAVETYKTNVYVQGGTPGNTGWSYYADIIKPISEYVE